MQKQPLQLHRIPDLPWSITAADIFVWNKHHYLMLVDSYSGWFEVDKLEKTNISFTDRQTQMPLLSTWDATETGLE